MKTLTGLLIFTVFLIGGCVKEKQPAFPLIQPIEWTTIYSTGYSSENINPFEFHPAKIKDWEIYPDHPCVKAVIENGMLITTTIPLQNCWIEGLNENLSTHWSDVAVVTHKEEYIFPHPKIRMTAKFMFPSEDFGEEYFFHMNPEIFTDKDRGNYNLFAQIRVSNRGNVIYIGEKDREMFLDKIEIEPDRWYDVELEVDMKTRKYIKASVDDTEWNSDDFKSRFTLRDDNGMDDFRAMMGFWIGNNLGWEDAFGDNMGANRELYVDSFKVEIAE